MSKLFELLDGKKSYFIALGLAAVAVAKYFFPAEVPIELLGMDTTGEYSLVAALLWAWRSSQKKLES